MRFWEEALLVCAIPLVLEIVVPQRRQARWLALFSLAVIAVFVTHLAAEGYRWQMVPAYLLTGVILSFAMRQRFRTTPRRRAPRWHVVGAGLLGALLLAVGVALPMLLPVPHLQPRTDCFLSARFRMVGSILPAKKATPTIGRIVGRW